MVLTRTEPAYTLPVYVTCSVLAHDRLTPGEACALLNLSSRAFQEDYAPFWRTYGNAVHVLLTARDQIVATACWLDRALQQEERPPLHTAYVEGVAVDPAHQGRGYGRALMSVITQQVWDYELAALSTGACDFYARMGWEPWRGPTFVRTPTGPISTPDEGVMILRTGRTPGWLDPSAPLSCERRDAPEIW